jgi:hypothetical protein
MSASIERIFSSDFILEIFNKLSREKQTFSQNVTIVTDTLHENVRNFMTYPWNSLGLKRASEIN